MKRKKIKPKLKPLTYWATLSLLLFGLLVMSGPSLVFAQAAPVIDPVDDINVAAGGTAAVTITVTDDGVPYTGSLELYDKREPVGSLNNPTITPIIVISASDYTFTDNLDDSFTFSWDTTGFDGGSYLARFTADDGINPAVDELFSINVAQVIPATILARTFSDPLPWYGGNPVAPFTVAIETSPAKNLGWITAGEYVEYVIDVPAAGEYNFEFFAGKGNGGTLTTTLSEEDGLGGFSSIGSFGATDTGWQNYASYTFSAIFANAGVQTLRLDFSGGGGINIRDFIISPPGDNVPPVITLNGVDPVVLNVGDPFNDPEATVVDDVDGTITTSLAGDVSGLDTNTVGSYEIPYNATDAAGNAAAEVLRTVHVFPTTAGTPLYRVNAGGPLVAAIDGSGVDWEQDQGAFGDANNSTYLLDLPTGTTIFTASSGSAHPGAVDTSDASIPATTPATIFDTERYDNNGGTPDMVWQFPVTPGTDYEVRFYFAELFSGVDEVGQRVASINIEGNVPAILTDIDQIAIAGPKGGFMRSTIINAGDSLLDIETVRVVQNPAFKAIEIIDLSPPPNQPPVITAILPQTVNEDGNLSVPLTISDAEGDDLTVSITTASDEPLLLQTVNGGSNNVQADPYPFTADGFFSESSINDTSGSYTSSLDFTPTFGDGGGADGDGDGKYTITIEVDDGNGNVETNTFELTVNDVAQSIAGTGTTKIEAESFDNQGPANPNPNGSGNSNGIGVEVNGSGVTNIGYSHNGDFVEYEIDVAQAGTYDIEFQIGKSNGADGTLNIVDPVTSNVLGSIAVNDATGGWQVYQPFSTQIALPSGPQTLRFEWVSATTNFLFNVDFFELTYVPPPNSDPDAVDDSVTTDEDTAVTIDVLDNDTDADAGDVLSVTGDSGASNGTTLINPDNTITYTPDTNFNGSDSFTYDISDGNSGTDTATVNITVNPINDAPVNTVPGPQSVDEDVPLAVTGISAADVDGNLASTELSVSNGTLAVTLSGSATINAGANGSSALTISGSEADINGTLASLTYQGDLNFNGGDVLTVVSTDSAGVPLSDTDTVAITVNPVNNPPVNTVPGAQLIDEDEPLSISGISVTDVDGNLASAEISVDNGTLTVILGNATLSAGANGSSSLTLTGAEADINSALGSLSYQGSLNFNGGDTLTIVSTDGAGNPLSDTDTVSITVDPVNDPPVAVNDGETTSEETPITIDVLTNDSDVDTGDVITLDSASSPTSEGGTAIINAGQIDYTPALNFNGTDTFTYQISDIDGETASATVTVVVGAANDVPVANDDTASVDEDMTVVIDVLDNDTDADVGDTLVVDSIFSDPASGTAIINLNGDIEYTPSANFNGSDSLEYLLSDENGGFDTALVTITVNPINDDPLAEDDVTSTAEDTAVVINVLVNDSDIEGDDLEISSAGPASNGIVAISNDLLSVTYTPALNFNGSDSFDYTISDGNGGTATASVTVNVGSANDNPTAVDDTVTTDEDSPITIAVLDNDTDPDIGTSLSVA
ncbi:MAG: tandem-95 repeat protein, partial [Chloroflexota bacterium]